MHVIISPDCEGKQLIICTYAYTFLNQNDPLKKDLRREDTDGNIRRERAALSA